MPTMKHQTLRIAFWIAYEQSGSLGGPAHLPAVLGDEYTLRDARKELKAAGWLVPGTSLNGSMELNQRAMRNLISPAGQNDYRLHELDYLVLHWIAANDGGSLEYFAAGITRDITGSFEVSDVLASCDRLTKHGLIRTHPDPGHLPNDATLTSLGRQCWKSELSPDDFIHSEISNGGQVQFNSNFHGNVTGIQQGSGNSMEINQTAYDPQNQQIIDLLAELRKLILESQPSKASYVSVIEDEVNTGRAEPGVIRTLVNSVATGLGNNLGKRLFEIGNRLGELLQAS